MSSTKTIVEIFLAKNPNIYVQKGKYLGRWRFHFCLFGDLPFTMIQKYAVGQGIDTKWTHDNRNLYFNDDRLIGFVEAVATRAYCSEVRTEKQVLKEDVAWKEGHAYRVLFDRKSRPSSEELASKGLDGELVIGDECHRYTNDGRLIPISHPVLAVLTDSDDTWSILKLSYPGVTVEER